MPVPDPVTAAVRFSLDFLFLDQEAIPTLVECKRFSDTRSLREIIGQMLEYAANGHHYWRKDLLRKLAEESAIQGGRDFDQAIAILQPLGFETVDDFFNTAEQNLREGHVRIIFFLEDSPLELRSVVNFLSKQMENLEMFIVEARQYKMNNTVIVAPALIGFTDKMRQEIRLSSPQSTATGRKLWTEELFFEDARLRLGDGAEPLSSLYKALVAEGFTITWGTGQKIGSFNPKRPDLTSGSFMTACSDGRIYFNFVWLPESITVPLKSLMQNLGMLIDMDRQQPVVQIEMWREKVPLLVQGLKAITNKLEEWGESTDQLSAVGD